MGNHHPHHPRTLISYHLCSFYAAMQMWHCKSHRFQSISIDLGCVHLFISTAGTHFTEAHHCWSRRTSEDYFSKCSRSGVNIWDLFNKRFWTFLMHRWAFFCTFRWMSVCFYLHIWHDRCFRNDACILTWLNINR